jgi:hypothetical protein
MFGEKEHKIKCMRPCPTSSFSPDHLFVSCSEEKEHVRHCYIFDFAGFSGDLDLKSGLDR